jgi:hypothetical protein
MAGRLAEDWRANREERVVRMNGKIIRSKIKSCETVDKYDDFGFDYIIKCILIKHTRIKRH